MNRSDTLHTPEESRGDVGSAAIFHDISDRRRVLDELRKSEERLSIALSASSTGLWDYNPIEDRSIYSDTWFRMLGYEPVVTPCNGDTFFSLLHPDDHAAYKAEAERHMRAETNAVEAEFRMRRQDGSWAWIRSIGKVIERDPHGRVSRLVGVHIDATAAHQIQSELAAAKDVAVRANQAKSDFLATMSHEIRTPMNAIIGLSHLMARTEMAPRQRDYISKIQNASQSLLAIINDILDFSKIEAGKLNIEAVDFNLDDVIENVVSVINTKLLEKNLELVVSRAPNVPNDFVGDPLRLSQLLMNLLSNAAKFTPSGEILVTIEGREIEDGQFRLEVAVADTGIGMSEAQMASLFRPFTQADASTSRRFGGTGLGLAICRQLLQLMGGDITVASVEGVGTTFSFHAPFRLAAPSLLAARDAAALSGKRALVVDDSKSARRILRDALIALGLEVEEAGGGAEALERLSRPEPFDLILLDGKMPDIDGIEVVSRLRARGLTTPILMITAYGQAALEAEIAERLGDAHGVAGVLEKPASPKPLKERVLAAFGVEAASGERGARAGRRASDILLPNVQILLVEDNPINQQVATELLESLGVETTVAGSGEEALEILAARQFDLILMDIQMPGKDGLATTVAIRTELGLTATPIIAMTASAMAGDRERCLESGMNDHIGKPIDPDNLALTLARWLENAQPNGQKRRKTAPGVLAPLDPNAPIALPGVDAAFALRNLNGNRALLLQLLRVFAEEHAGQGAALRAALEVPDWRRVNGVAHTLKGAGSTLGATTVARIAAELEAMTKPSAEPPSRSRAAELVGALALALAEVVEGVRSQLPSAKEPAATTAPATPPTAASVLPAIDALAKLLALGDADAEPEAERLAALLANTGSQKRSQDIAASAARYDFDGAQTALAELRAELTSEG